MGETQRGRSPSGGHHQSHPNHHTNHSLPLRHFPEGLDLDTSIPSAAYSDSSFRADLPQQTYSQDLLLPAYINDSPSLQNFSGILIPDSSKGFGDFPQHQDLTTKQEQDYSRGGLLSIEADLSGGMQLHLQSINPADLMSAMSSPQKLIPTPPNLIPLESTSPRAGSPSPHQGQLYSPEHSRHTSLDPSSAMFAHGQQGQDWTSMLQQHQFRRHQRAPSEYSDVSSSVAHSPFLTQPENGGFDGFDQNPSPLLNAQDNNNLYQDALGIGNFSLSDPQQQQQQQQQLISPRNSPYVSPRISPQQGLDVPQENNFVLSQHDLHNFNGGPGPEIYTSQPEAYSPFPARHGSGDLGQAAQMAPPEINVEFAPTTRHPVFESSATENDHDALSPPGRNRILCPKKYQLTTRPPSGSHRIRGRHRAKSDPYISRPVSPGSNSITPSLDIEPTRNRSLSPFDTTSLGPLDSHSREVSPSSKSCRRSSTSSIPNRDYILELADPTRPAASGTDKRVQKHPATFQCTLCPKRFTRAYNLRSHLRTHTDERPFVCTVCGKAFARQHDRKRHEGLHSGEKKFVCKGELGTGGSWGCGRRFARADALGRHFRSEAGRICIKPLLDEEAMERQRVFEEQMNIRTNQSMQSTPQQQHPAQNITQSQQTNGNGGFTLPAALLAQYPALQALQWDQLGVGPGSHGDDGEGGGKNYDGSSQGEYFDDEDGYGSGVNGAVDGGGGGWGGSSGGEWASDYEGR